MLHGLASMLGDLEADRMILEVHVRFRGNFEARRKLVNILLNGNVRDSDRNDNIMEAIFKSAAAMVLNAIATLRVPASEDPGDIGNPNC